MEAYKIAVPDVSVLIQLAQTGELETLLLHHTHTPWLVTDMVHWRITQGKTQAPMSTVLLELYDAMRYRFEVYPTTIGKLVNDLDLQQWDNRLAELSVLAFINSLKHTTLHDKMVVVLDEGWVQDHVIKTPPWIRWVGTHHLTTFLDTDPF